MLNKISFHGKPPIIHDYYPVKETVHKAAEAAKKNVEAYTRFDGLNSEATARKVIRRPKAGSNVHLKTEDLVEKDNEQLQEVVDSANSMLAADKYEQFSSF